MKDKLNIIFKPFVFSLIGLTIGYTFFHWVLFIQLDLFSLKEFVTNFVIPAVLAGLASLFFLRPKLKALRLETKRGNMRDFYCFIAWFALAIPLIIAQEYIVTATGKLTQLNSINEINNSAPTKYYSLKSYYINKKAIGFYSSFKVSGKHNQNLDMHIYIVMPILGSEKDTLIDKPLAWLGVKYGETISNDLDQNEKDTKYREFADASERDFFSKNVSRFVYLDRLGNSDDRDGYFEAIRRNQTYESNETILVGVDEPFEARNGKKLPWIFGSALIGSLVWLIMLSIPKIDQKQLSRIKARKPDRVAQKEMREFLDFLRPKEGYFVTPILIYINIGIFLLMVINGLGFISFKASDLLQCGANYGPLTKSGEWWRLLANTFLHGGLMHVLMNMFGLLFVGIFLEPILGRTRYIIAYFVTGILASVASICWYDATVSIGASGAIFGLYGVFLALLLIKVYPPDFARMFLITTVIFIGYNLLMGLAGGIDNAAHIGGLLSGFLFGLILYPTLKREAENETE